MPNPNRFLLSLSLCIACPKAQPNTSDASTIVVGDEDVQPVRDSGADANISDTNADSSNTEIAAILQPETNQLDTAMRKDWPPLEWAHARAYTYNFVPYGPGQKLRVWDDSGWSTSIETQVDLTPEQANATLELTHRTLGDVNASKCAFPRHAVVFFDDSDQPVASVNVCFECTDIMLWPAYDPDPRSAMIKYRELSTVVLDDGDEIEQPLVFTVHDEVMDKWSRLFLIMELPDYSATEATP